MVGGGIGFERMNTAMCPPADSLQGEMAGNKTGHGRRTPAGGPLRDEGELKSWHREPDDYDSPGLFSDFNHHPNPDSRNQFPASNLLK